MGGNYIFIGGDQIIAIEKYTKGESVELTKNNPIKLFNIVDILGEKMEQELGVPARDKYKYGLNIDQYLCGNDFWVTKEEWIKMKNNINE